MEKMTSKERILRTFRRQEVDHIPMVDYPWATTAARWVKEGMPANVDWRDYFGFDKIAQVKADNSPRYPRIVYEENDEYVIQTTSFGRKEKVFRNLTTTPEPLEFYYNTSKRWEEAKAKILEFHEDRIPWKTLEKNYPIWKKEGRFLELGLWFGFDVTHSGLVGTEDLLIAMYEEPEWVTDMFDTYLTVSLDLAQRILDAGYAFDSIFWWDDMGYKGSPFFSPAAYRELLKPFHKRAVDWAHERGMLAELHSCGFIEPMIPDLVDIGVDMLNPIEVKAGMDPKRLKENWGDKLAFHGGINAQIWDQPELVRAEMEKIIPIMKEGGGYMFASDHSIPDSVSLENMRIISDLAHKLGKY